MHHAAYRQNYLTSHYCRQLHVYTLKCSQVPIAKIYQIRIRLLIILIVNYFTSTVKHTYTHTQPFYGSVEFVQNNPGEPVPEETFTHSHSSWPSVIPICFLHLLRSMASSVFNPRALQKFNTD